MITLKYHSVHPGLNRAASFSSTRRGEGPPGRGGKNKEEYVPLRHYPKTEKNITQAFRRPQAAGRGSATQSQEEREWFEKDAAFQSCGSTGRWPELGGARSNEGGRCSLHWVAARLGHEGSTPKALMKATGNTSRSRTDGRAGREKSRSCSRKGKMNPQEGNLGPGEKT